MTPPKEYQGLALVPDEPATPPDDRLIVVVRDPCSQPSDRDLRMVRKYEDQSGVPGQYMLRSLRLWRHPRQVDKKWNVKGWVIFRQLQRPEEITSTSTLNLGAIPFDSCLGYSDAKVHASDPVMFLKVFGGRAPTYWKAVAEDSEGNHYVLNLFYFHGEVVEHWRRLDYDWTFYTVHHGDWDGDEPIR